jgi:hypothetical protein
MKPISIFEEEKVLNNVEQIEGKPFWVKKYIDRRYVLDKENVPR